MSAAPPWSSSRAPMSAASDSAVGHNSTISPSPAAASRWCKSSRPASSACGRVDNGAIDEGEALVHHCHADQTLAPAAAATHVLPERQRVEEFVGEQDHRAARHLREHRMPRGRRCRGRERLALPSAQHRAGLDQVQTGGRDEFGGDPSPRPPGVGRQRAASGAEFHQPNRVRRTHRPPDLDAPRADQFAEHLADLRRGGEVAGGAERIAGRVVAVFRMSERFGHVVGQAQRAALGDSPAQQRRQLRHAAERRRRAARSTNHRPISSIGSDSSWPMVRPCMMKPRCASGSRNSSQNDRKTP